MIETKTLQDLPLNREIPAEIILAAVDKFEKDGETTYLFDSASYAYPHRLVVNTSGQLLERSVYLSQTDQEYYKNMLSQLGEPDAKVAMTEHTSRQIFLKQGLIFLGDDEGTINTVTSASQERISKITGFLQKLEAEPREASTVAAPTKTKIQQAMDGDVITNTRVTPQPTLAGDEQMIESTEEAPVLPTEEQSVSNQGVNLTLWVVVGFGIVLLGIVALLIMRRIKKPVPAQQTTASVNPPPISGLPPVPGS